MEGEIKTTDYYECNAFMLACLLSGIRIEQSFGGYAKNNKIIYVVRYVVFNKKKGEI